MPGRNVGLCETCGREYPVWGLPKCPVCGHVTCLKCATFQYGRHFCSKRCALYFVHAEGDEEEDAQEET